MLANDAQIMGAYRNTPALNAIAIAVGALLVLAGLAYALSVLFPSLLG